MDWTDIRVWAALAIVAQFILAALYWVGRKSFPTTETLLAVNKVLQDQIDEQSRRVTSAHHRSDLLEEKLKSLPDHDDHNKLRDSLARLDSSVNRISGEVASIDSKIDRTTSVVDRIEAHLLRAAG